MPTTKNRPARRPKWKVRVQTGSRPKTSFAEWHEPTDNGEPPVPKPRHALGFLARVAKVLNISHEQLRDDLQLSQKELRRLITLSSSRLAGMDEEPMWADLASVVAGRLGRLIALRELLQRKLAADRRDKLIRRMEIENR